MSFDEWWEARNEGGKIYAYLDVLRVAVAAWTEAQREERQRCFESLCLGCREQLPLNPTMIMSGSPLGWAHECDDKTMICTASQLRVAVSLSDEKAKLKEE